MRKILTVIIIALIAIAIIIVAIMFMSPKKPKHIQIYAHRGGRALSPENTIPAYKTGLAIGIDFVDMDVNMTKDGVVVVTHNMRLNPDLTRDKHGNWIDPTSPTPIKDLTFKQLQTYDVGRLKPGTDYAADFPYQYPVDGTHISSLKQVIEYVKQVAGNKVNFQVEIKTDPTHPDWTYSPEAIAAATVKVLKDEKIDTRTELQAFDWRVLLVVQRLDPKIATAYLTDAEIAKNMLSDDPKEAGLWSAGYFLKNYRDSIPRMIAKLGGKVWGPESKELTQDLVKEAHAYGLKVVPWSMTHGSLQDPQEIIRMINLGVDGIISDRPDVVRGFLAARGIKVPEAFIQQSKSRRAQK